MKLMLTCKETSEVLSEARDNSLPWTKRIMLKMHLMMCHHCNNYKSQLSALYLTYQKLRTKMESDPEIQLPDKIKDEIKIELHNHSSL